MFWSPTLPAGGRLAAPLEASFSPIVFIGAGNAYTGSNCDEYPRKYGEGNPLAEDLDDDDDEEGFEFFASLPGIKLTLSSSLSESWLARIRREYLLLDIGFETNLEIHVGNATPLVISSRQKI